MNLPRTNEGRFLILFFALAVAGLALLVWEKTEGTTSLRDAALDIVQDMEAMVVVGAIVAYAVIEGGSMLAERYKREKYKEGRQDERRDILERLDPQTREVVERTLNERRGRSSESSRQHPDPQ